MIKSRKLVLVLLTAIICAALAGAVWLLGANSSHARASADEPSHGDLHATVLSADTTIADGGKYYLSDNLTRNIEIPAGSTVELCLNGRTLTGTGTGYVITVVNGATLKLHDCVSENKGTVTCGNGQSGCVSTDGSFEIYGGKIVGDGISDGVYIKNGKTDMSGGEVRGHATGVNVDGGSFTMTGGKITGNQVGVDAKRTITLGGKPQVVDNTSKNIAVKGDKHIEINDKFESDVLVGVTLENSQGVFTQNYSEHNTDHPAKYFYSDNGAYYISLNNGEAEVSSTVEISGITAEFNQGDTVIYSTTPLDSLKANLKVQVKNNDGSFYNDGAPLNDSEYTLSGELTTSESVITVTYGNFQTTFTVTVSIESPCDPPADDSGNTTGGNTGGNPGNDNRLWLCITLSVVLLLDVGILIYQLVNRKKNGSSKQRQGGNE